MNIGSTIKVLDILFPDCSDIGGQLPALTMGEQGVCAHCGHKISVRALCEDEHGNVFELGRTCARKNDSVHQLSLKSVEEKAEARRMRSLIANPGFIAWASALPHPKGWARKTLLDDVRYWASVGKWANVRPALAAFSGATDETPVQVSAKDQQRIDAVHALIAQAEAIKVAYTAACEVAAKRIRDLPETLKTLTAANVDASIIAYVVESAHKPVNHFEFVHGYSDYGIGKIKGVLARSGIQTPKTLSTSELAYELEAIAKKYGVATA